MSIRRFSVKRSLCAAAVATAALASVSANASPQYFASARVVAGNVLPPGIGYITDVAPWALSGTPGQTVQSNGQVSYSGKDISGNDATMVLNYSAAAQANATSLKVSSYGKLLDAFYNANNPDYVFNSSFGVDPDGVPDRLIVSAEASIRDTLTVSGADGLAYVKANIAVDGKILSFGMGSVGGLAMAGVQQFDAGYVYTNLFAAHGVEQYGQENLYNTTLSTTGYAVAAGKISFGLRILADINFILETGSGIYNPVYEGYSDFFNTLDIDSFAGFDANGNPLDLFSVTGSGGQVYATVRVDGEPPANDVPEPGTLALAAIGLLGGAATRQRRKF